MKECCGQSLVQDIEFIMSTWTHQHCLHRISMVGGEDDGDGDDWREADVTLFMRCVCWHNLHGG